MEIVILIDAQTFIHLYEHILLFVKKNKILKHALLVYSTPQYCNKKQNMWDHFKNQALTYYL